MGVVSMATPTGTIIDHDNTFNDVNATYTFGFSTFKQREMFFPLLTIFNLGFYFCAVHCDESYFWQITDIHWDSDYSRIGDTSQMCTDQSRKGDVGPVKDNGYFGNYSCDSPFPLVVSAIEAMANFHPNPDFILWTGDMLPHRLDIAESEIFSLLKNVTDLLISHFPNVTIIPVFGNHETVPKDQFPDDDPTFYPNYLSKAGWDFLIPLEETPTFKLGGYYSVRVKPGLHVLAINTIIYKLTNKEVSEDEKDPAGQFQWMKSKLQAARHDREKVIITAHCPPGYNFTFTSTTFKENFNDQYVNLMLDYSDVIVAHIYGHLHRDVFQLFVNDNFEVLGFSLVAPPVTPWGPDKRLNANNPAIRQYKYDTSSYLITDYYQYMLNLSLANEKYRKSPDNADQWVLLYRFTTEYDVPNLSVPSMLRHFDNLRTDATTMGKFVRHFFVDYDPLPCDAKCKTLFVCNLGFLKGNLLKKCREDNATTHLKLGTSGAASFTVKLFPMLDTINHSLVVTVMFSVWALNMFK